MLYFRAKKWVQILLSQARISHTKYPGIFTQKAASPLEWANLVCGFPRCNYFAQYETVPSFHGIRIANELGGYTKFSNTSLVPSLVLSGVKGAESASGR